MAIVYPLTMPATPAFRVSGWTFEGHTRSHESPDSRAEQVIALAGQRWRGVYTLPPMRDDQARAWRAFGVQLNGTAGTFLGFDPASRSPAGTPAGTPRVDGAHVAGSVDIATENWTSNRTGLLLPGDYVQLTLGGAEQLKMVLNSVDSDGTGKATMTIGPPLHAAAAGGESVVHANPVGRFRLDEDAYGWELDQMLTLGISFAVKEAIPNV